MHIERGNALSICIDICLYSIPPLAHQVPIQLVLMGDYRSGIHPNMPIEWEPDAPAGVLNRLGLTTDERVANAPGWCSFTLNNSKAIDPASIFIRCF